MYAKDKPDNIPRRNEWFEAVNKCFALYTLNWWIFCCCE